MCRRFRQVVRRLGIALVLVRMAQAQTAPPATVTDALMAMAARAGVIFAGHVVAIDRQDAAGFVDVRFHVDEAVLGVSGNSIYVMREWSGLWNGGVERYQVGQRLLMMLHPRGPSGMSSPVNGRDGAIPILPGAVAPLANGTGVVTAETLATPSDALVDLRWLAAETLRTPAGVAPGWVALPRAANDPGWFGAVAPLPATATTKPVPGAGTPAYGLVMMLLKGGGGVISEPMRKPVTLADTQR